MLNISIALPATSLSTFPVIAIAIKTFNIDYALDLAGMYQYYS